MQRQQVDGRQIAGVLSVYNMLHVVPKSPPSAYRHPARDTPPRCSGVLVVVRGENLRSRSEQITVGMPREQVEEILGPPVLELPRSAGKRPFRESVVLIWVDQFWQVDVITDREGNVESIECLPSDSLYRRTIGRVVTFPK